MDLVNFYPIDEQQPAKPVAHSAHLKSSWDTLLQGTQFQTLTGAKIEAGVGEKPGAMPKFCYRG